jgi:hypothetical protein
MVSIKLPTLVPDTNGDANGNECTKPLLPDVPPAMKPTPLVRLDTP